MLLSAPYDLIKNSVLPKNYSYNIINGMAKLTILFFIVLPTVKPCNVRRIAGNAAVYENSVAVTFLADDSRATFHCKLDSARFKTCKLHKHTRS